MADPAPIWQKPLVSLTQFFLKTPVQVRAHDQISVLTGMFSVRESKMLCAYLQARNSQ